MKLLKFAVGLAVVVTLTACGGGGGSAGTPSGSTATAPTTAASTPATVEVLTSTNILMSAGSEAVVTAFVKNSANVGLSGQAVVFSASSGTLQVTSSTTDLTGAATAKLMAGSDKSIRNITVSATASGAVGSVVIPVSGTTLSIAGSGSLQLNGAAAQYTVRAIDSSSNAISGAQIKVTSSLGNLISPSSLPLTDVTGATSFSYTPKISGSDTLTVTGLGATAKTDVAVSAVDLVVLSPGSNTVVNIGTPKAISVQYRVNNVGVPGKTVVFSTTRGTFSPNTAITDASGQASADLTSTTVGSALVIAQIADVGVANLPVQFVATTPASIVVQANPGSVLPNSKGSTTSYSNIEAFVRDASGNAVANQQVNFSILEDLSNGSLSDANSKTDANGRVQVQFFPGTSSTQVDGVRIQAQVASTLAVVGEAHLTVNGKALFISIGFGNTISNLNVTTYSKEFTVYVTDANGVAVGNQLVNLSALPTAYFKGFLTWQDPVWAYSSTSPTSCLNEDLNLNGFLDSGEDTNHDGLLTPGNVVVVAPGAVTTDASGRATFSLQYGEQYAKWVNVSISARASVAGTESRQSNPFMLIGLSDDYSSQTIAPAGVRSPWGPGTSCSDTN